MRETTACCWRRCLRPGAAAGSPWRATRPGECRERGRVSPLDTVRLDPLLLRSVIAPPLMVDGIKVPVIESIFESSVCMLSVTLTWLPVAPEATKVMGVPLTTMLSPAAKLGSASPCPRRPTAAWRRDARGNRSLLLTALPAIPTGGWVADGAEAERGERGRVRTRRSARAVVVFQRDHTIATVDGVRCRNRIDFREQRLHAVGDVDLVAGSTRATKGDGVPLT